MLAPILILVILPVLIHLFSRRVEQGTVETDGISETPAE
jgi:hypothetical protein